MSLTLTHEEPLRELGETMRDNGIERLNAVHPLKHTVLKLETALLECNRSEMALLVELGELKSMMYCMHKGGPWATDHLVWKPRFETLRKRALEALYGR